MSEDIGRELAQKIESEFKEKYVSDKRINALAKKKAEGKATHKDCYGYSERVGKLYGESFRKFVTAENLPNGNLYYNVAKSIIEPTLRKSHLTVSEYARDVEESLLKSSGINIKPQVAKLNQERIDGIVEKVSFNNGRELEDVDFMFSDRIIQNFNKEIVTDTIEENAEFCNGIGVTVYIRRVANGGCCEWCEAQCGTYEYESNGYGLPEYFFSSHTNCTCTWETFTTKQVNTRRQFKTVADKDGKMKLKREVEFN